MIFAVMAVAGGVFQSVACARVEVVQGERVLVELEAFFGGEVLGVANGFRDAAFVDLGMDEVLELRLCANQSSFNTRPWKSPRWIELADIDSIHK